MSRHNPIVPTRLRFTDANHIQLRLWEDLAWGDEHAGRRIKCPACNAIGTAPKPELEPVFEIIEPVPVPLPEEPAPSERAKPYSNPRAEFEEYDGTVYGLDKSSRLSSGGDEKSSDPRDKPLPDFRLGSGQRGRSCGRKKN